MGSRAGIPNKRKGALLRRIQEEFPDYNPVISMVRIAHEAEKENNTELAAKMHREVAQYVEPKRKAIEVTGEDGGPIKLQSKQLAVVGVPSENEPDADDCIPGGN